MGDVLSWLTSFRFLTGESLLKIKNLVPHVESRQIKLFLKASENPNRMTPVRDYRLPSEDLSMSFLLIPFSLLTLTLVPTYLPRSS